MKTAISLPERIFREAERFARKTKKSRSQLYSEAISEYLVRHSSNEITELMNEACSRIDQTDTHIYRTSTKKVFKNNVW